MSLISSLANWFFSLFGSGEYIPGTLAQHGYDEEEMDAAIARARREVDDFIRDLANEKGDSFSIKVGIEDEGDTEHFWLVDVTYQEGIFKGTINNDPGFVENVWLGQLWKVKKEEISDWLIMRDDKMHGNYTMRPLLKNMPAEQAAQYRAMLANP